MLQYREPWEWLDDKAPGTVEQNGNSDSEEYCAAVPQARVDVDLWQLSW
jgi:hypothetical protein